jgi:hypothetical protein
MDRARASLSKLVERNEVTAGMSVRAHGENLILSRDEEAESGEMVPVDRVKLTRLGTGTWGLSVKRHTGRWQQTPFRGDLETVVEAIWTFMQHLVARY